jgi:hypothetical protein
MNPKKLGLAAVSVLAAGAIIGGTAALASADPSPTGSASTSATPGSTDKGARQGHTHTAATDDEAQKVKDAIAAKDSSVTIEKVQKDEDGSFDADGTTADGTKVRFDVSADYATVSDAKTGGGRGAKGGGGHSHTEASADETAQVTAAVTAKDSSVTIEKVMKDEDGSFDAVGAKADGTKVRFDVSADYVTVSDAKTGGRGGKGGPASQSGQSGQSSTGTPTDANGTEGATTPAT